MPFFNQKRPKRFRYKSRFNDDSENKESVKTEWEKLREDSKLKKGKISTLIKLLILLVLVLILLFVLNSY